MKLQSICYPIIDTNENTDSIKLKVSASKKQAMYIIHKALTIQLNNKRQGTAHTKTKSEVKGGGKKPWKQKGTGRARAGSIRSPLWKGGGVVFGPKAGVYTNKINKKEKKLALRNLIYNKHKQTIVTSVETIINKPYTQGLVKILKDLGTNVQKEKILIIVNQKDRNLYLSARNLANVELIKSDQLNILSMLRADKLITDIKALERLYEVYN